MYSSKENPERKCYTSSIGLTCNAYFTRRYNQNYAHYFRNTSPCHQYLYKQYMRIIVL